MRKAPKGCYWRGDTIWGRVKTKGVDKRFSLRTDDPKVARRRYQEVKDQIVDGTYYADCDGALSFDEVYAQWGSWIGGQVREGTQRRYAVSLGQLQPWLQGKPLAEIDGKFIAQIIRERKATPATLRRDLVALSSVMNFALDQGWTEDNPVLPRMRRIKERRDPIVLPTIEDVDRVVSRVPGLLGALIQTARYTGARLSELTHARRSQLDLGRRRLEIIGKGNKRRVVDLTPFDAWKVLEGVPEVSGPLFWHGEGKPYLNLSSRFAALNEGRFRFHDLRHLHAVEWLRSGRSIYDLQQRLGHSSIKVTEMYLAFLTPEEKREAQGHNKGHTFF